MDSRPVGADSVYIITKRRWLVVEDHSFESTSRGLASAAFDLLPDVLCYHIHERGTRSQ